MELKFKVSSPVCVTFTGMAKLKQSNTHTQTIAKWSARPHTIPLCLLRPFPNWHYKSSQIVPKQYESLHWLCCWAKFVEIEAILTFFAHIPFNFAHFLYKCPLKFTLQLSQFKVNSTLPQTTEIKISHTIPLFPDTIPVPKQSKIDQIPVWYQ